MIYDLISNKDIYEGLGDKYKKAFEFIINATKDGIEKGKYFIDEDTVYAIVNEYDTKTEGFYEAHKRYIDLQYVVSGHEQLYWKNIKDCTVTREYDPTGDSMLLTAEDPVVLDMPAGTFALLYPEDVHAPARAYKEVSHVKKIVVKIKID